MILSEYAACYHSAQFLSPAGLHYLIDSVASNLKEYFVQLKQAREDYGVQKIDLGELDRRVIRVFWRALTEFAKIFAYVNGNRTLAPSGTFGVCWPGATEAGEQLPIFFERLRDAWREYPNCTDAFRSTCEETWYTVTFAEGWLFGTDSEGRDYLRFD